MYGPFIAAGVGDGSFGSMMASAEAADARRAAKRAQSDADQTEARLNRLALTCEALWVIVRDKLCVSDEELIDKITELDLSDGKLDGKVSRAAVACPKCGKTIGRRFPKCMYCGQPVMHDPFS